MSMGECCKTTVCGLGYWDEEYERCGYLIEVKGHCFSHAALYDCAIAEGAMKHPAPNVGAGLEEIARRLGR